MKKIFENDWQVYLDPEFQKEYYLNLRTFLVAEYRNKKIFPAMQDIFNALHYTSYQNTKIVILGQDPYHQEGQAHGLSFSVKPNISIPPSLQNIYKELKTDIGCFIPNNGYLENWARQGVLMLNTVLTVQAGLANSHHNKGWENFTDCVINHLNEREKSIIFILWGKSAMKKSSLITEKQHKIISSPHPSPLSAHRGFFGSKPFSKANHYLTLNGEKPIDWQIKNI